MDFTGPAALSGYRLTLHHGGLLAGLTGSHFVVDVETDESDVANFVGLALVDFRSSGDDPKHVHYFSVLTEELKGLLSKARFVGHNVKSDLHWLNQWGCSITAEQMHGDTMIAAYCRDTTEEEYGLKALAKKHLGWSWTSYKDLVGKGKRKTTLDKQPVEVVANYCATDAAATLELFRRQLNGISRRCYEEVEMPVYRALFRMETFGAAVDVPYLHELDNEFCSRRDEELASVRSLVKSASFNPASPKQVKNILFKVEGIREKKTDVATLTNYDDRASVKALLNYREFSKLTGTYTGPLLSSPTPGIIHARFNQVSYDSDSEHTKGIRTGRLSSSEPNLQNIPARTETGKKVRKAFVARPGNLLVVADYSQIELRVLAHYSGEKAFLDAFHAGRDVHTETAHMVFGKATSEEQETSNRRIAKTINFGLLYGCGPKKLAFLTGVSVDVAQGLLDTYWKRLPGIQQWIASAKANAYVRGGITTLGGRFIPLHGLRSKDLRERLGAERQAVNYTIQGSAAEIMKKALVRIDSLRLPLTMPIHDEVVLDVKAESAPAVQARVKGIMENVVVLKVPLVVDAHTGLNWAEAKG